MGAPSISSMIRQLGFSSAPSTDFIWVAASMRVLKVSGLRSSLWDTNSAQCHPSVTVLTGSCWYSSHLAFISTTLYPACCAMTCASVVFPRPGGPHSRATCRERGHGEAWSNHNARRTALPLALVVEMLGEGHHGREK